MPLTQLDDKAALIVIDLQKGLMGIPTAHPIADVVSHSSRLAHAFRERGLPVVLVNVSAMAPGRVDAQRPKYEFPPDWTKLVGELKQHENDILITKQRIGAFLGTELDTELKKRGVTQVFMTGVATSWGVESTARNAHDLGYHVVFVSDAMTDRDAKSHQHCIEALFPRMGEVESTENVLRVLNEASA